MLENVTNIATLTWVLSLLRVRSHLQALQYPVTVNINYQRTRINISVSQVSSVSGSLT